MFQDVTHKNTGKSNLLINPINQFPVNVRVYHIAFQYSTVNPAKYWKVLN